MIIGNSSNFEGLKFLKFVHLVEQSSSKLESFLTFHTQCGNFRLFCHSNFTWNQFWRMWKFTNAIFAFSTASKNAKNQWKIKIESLWICENGSFWTCKEIDFTENLSSRIFLKFPHWNFESTYYLDLEHCLSPLKFCPFFLIFDFLMGISSKEVAASVANSRFFCAKRVFGANRLF